MDLGAFAVGSLLLLFAVTGILLFRVSPAYVLGIHVLGRVVLDSVYAISYGEAAGGVTIMQLYSVAWSIFFIFYILYYRAGAVKLPNITLAVGFLVLSAGAAAAVNLSGMYFIQSSLKWFYFLSVVFFCSNALRRDSAEKLLLIVLFSGCYVFINQVILGVVSGPKISHGITNYIGSYYHEAGFSSLVLLMLAATLGIYTTRERRSVKFILLVFIVAELGSLVLAGYRTSLLAGMILLIAFLFLQSLRNVKNILLFAGAAVLGLLGILWLGVSGHLDLFEDIAKILIHPGQYFDFSGSGGDKEILTGRIYLLNMVVYLYLNADLVQQFIGMGPGIAQQQLGVYAHNELISALAEYGILGVIVFVGFHVQMVRVCLRARRRNLALGNLSLATVFSVIVLSMATMPYHDMRALLFLAVIYSLADYLGSRRNSVTAPPSMSCAVTPDRSCARSRDSRRVGRRASMSSTDAACGSSVKT